MPSLTMNERPSSQEQGAPPIESPTTQRTRDSKYINSVLSIPALIEATNDTPRSLDDNVQHQDRDQDQDQAGIGTISDKTLVTQTQTLGDGKKHNMCHNDGTSQEIQTNTQFTMDAGGTAKQNNYDTAHTALSAEPSAMHSLVNTSVSQNKIQSLPLTNDVSAEQNGGDSTLSQQDLAPIPPTSRAETESVKEPQSQKQAQEHEQNRAVESRAKPSVDNYQLPIGHDEPAPRSEIRQPLLSSPLTHPNGLSMFPNLSTPEQEQLAQEALTQAEDNIVADNSQGRDDESDGGYDSDGFSSGSTSAESSVRDYMYEHGRRYHRFREGHYNFPNDDVEQEREDMKHAMIKLLCSQKLHFAPIGNNPQEILDIGTGTGIWAIEMGDEFPSAHILGIDLSPIQPDWLPPNVRFMVDDAESPWLYPRNHFDYIHSRHTVMAIKDWSRLYRRAFEHLKPGGWIEMQEIHHKPRSANVEGVVSPDHPVAKFWRLVTEGLAALGVDLDSSSGGSIPSKMGEAGFTNITTRIFHVPIGTWPKNKVLKTVGLYWRTILLDGLQAIALGPLTRGLRWNREQVELLLMEVRRAYHDNATLMYMPLHVVYAQKSTTAY